MSRHTGRITGSIITYCRLLITENYRLDWGSTSRRGAKERSKESSIADLQRRWNRFLVEGITACFQFALRNAGSGESRALINGKRERQHEILVDNNETMRVIKKCEL